MNVLFYKLFINKNIHRSFLFTTAFSDRIEFIRNTEIKENKKLYYVILYLLKVNRKLAFVQYFFPSLPIRRIFMRNGMDIHP